MNLAKLSMECLGMEKRAKMSSIYRFQRKGRVFEGDLERMKFSILPIKRLARAGAVLVPMATPCFCLKIVSLKEKKLKLSTNFKRVARAVASSLVYTCSSSV